MTMPVLAIQQNNNGTALQEFFRMVQLDAENKVPSEALRIVGALSDGHIIESGDNANGYYVRFADGTQVCFGLSIVSANNSDTVTGSWTFPAEFIETACVSVLAAGSIGGGGFTTTFASQTDFGVTFYMFGLGGVRTGTQNAYCIAIGRWK